MTRLTCLVVISICLTIALVGCGEINKPPQPPTPTEKIYVHVDADETTPRDEYPNIANGDLGPAEYAKQNISPVVEDLDVNDSSGKGVPDFAEGFGKFDKNPSAYGNFVRIVIDLSQVTNLTGGKLRFDYSASDPNAVVQAPADFPPPYNFAYTLAPGSLRLWLRDNDMKSLRNPKDASSGGDFLDSGPAYDLSLFGLKANRLITVYVEAVDFNAIGKTCTVSVSLVTPKGNVVSSDSAPIALYWNSINNQEGPALKPDPGE